MPCGTLGVMVTPQFIDEVSGYQGVFCITLNSPMTPPSPHLSINLMFFNVFIYLTYGCPVVKLKTKKVSNVTAFLE